MVVQMDPLALEAEDGVGDAGFAAWLDGDADFAGFL
jgi:hypothetical protein